MDGAVGAKGQRSRPELSSVTLQVLRGTKLLTSAVCHGFTGTGAALASGLQLGSHLIERICRTFAAVIQRWRLRRIKHPSAFTDNFFQFGPVDPGLSIPPNLVGVF